VNDTPVNIEEEMIRRMKNLSGLERLKMGASMFDSAKRLVIASMGNGVDGSVLKRQIFLRFYGSDFNEPEKKRILSYLGCNG
jgi:hypothetical protein